MEAKINTKKERHAERGKFQEKALFVIGLNKDNRDFRNCKKVVVPSIKGCDSFFGYFTFETNFHRNQAFDCLPVVRENAFVDDLDLVSCSLIDWLPKLDSCIKDLNLLRKNWIELLSGAFSKKVKKTFDILYHKSRKISRNIIKKLLFPIRQHLFLLNDREKVNFDWNIDRFIVNIIFPVLYFYLTKLKTPFQADQLKFIQSLNLKNIRNSFESLENNSKILISDLLFQSIFHEDEFEDISKILSDLNFPMSQSELKFSSINSSFPCNLKKILMTGHHLILPHYSLEKYSNLINSFFDSLYFYSLPESIQGITLMNSNVLIKKSESELHNFDNILYQAFVLMTVLHELGHFEQRVGLFRKSEWFCFNTQKSYLVVDDEDQSTQGGDSNCSDFEAGYEGGTILMQKIFGFEPDTLGIKAAKFVLNPENWTYEYQVFKDTFSEVCPHRVQFKSQSFIRLKVE